jgi:adenylate cyclase
MFKFGQERNVIPIVGAIASVAATLLILGLRSLGTLEWLELVTYDVMMRLRPIQPPDSRILVVGITEQDIQDQGSILQFPDRAYADLLAKLWTARPRVIGLDIYRDKPVEPGHADFVKQLKRSDRMIGITKVGDERQPTIQPPKELPIDSQVGFNDVLVDRDGIIRRALFFQTEEKGEKNLASFSLQLAGRYLLDDDIEPQPSLHNPDLMRLGKATFVPLQPNDGSYVNANTEGQQVLLNYRGMMHTIPMVTFGDVLNNKVPANLIRDRIILIGSVAESAKDFFKTPFSAGQSDEQRMPGVFVHAQMVSQFLDAATGKRQLFWFWPDAIEGVWILGWSILGAVLAGRSRRPLFLLIATPLSLLVLGVTCFLIFLQAGWIPLIPPALGFMLSTGSMVAYMGQQAQKQQKMVMRLLGQSTSPEIAETLWQRRDELLDNGKLPGQKLTATLMFTDLRGFSSLSEHYPPEQLLAWLNEYLDEMAHIVQHHQGVINKFMGDGIMAVFGVPIAHEHPDEIKRDACNAVDCAIAMSHTLETLNQTWKSQGLPQVEMRVGIFTGPVVVGSVGSKIRLEYGVIGDSVNIASRLESLDKERQPSPCRILIAQQTQDHLGENYQFEPWGATSLKGKALQVDVFRVLGKDPARSELR